MVPIVFALAHLEALAAGRGQRSGAAPPSFWKSMFMNMKSASF